MHNKRIPELRATAKSLAEQRADALKEMQSVIDTAKAENRAMNDEETKRLGELQKAVEDIDKSIAAEKRALETLNAAATAAEAENGTESKIITSASEKRAVITEDDKRTFMNIVHNMSESRAGEQNFNMGNNGALIPTSISNRVVTIAKEICPILAGCDMYAIKGTLKIPVYGGKKVDGVEHNITVGYSDEFTELTADAGAFTSIDLTGFLVGALTLIGRSLINNSEIDVFDKIINEMGKAVAIWCEKELLIGTTNKCTGALSTPNIVLAGNTSSVSADTLIDMQAAIPTVYQANACWTMNPKTFTALRKLKDSTGQYLLQQSSNIANAFPYTILGKPVYLSDNMPLISSGAKPILYGDYSGLAVNMRENISMEVLREKYATMHAVGIVAWFEIDSKIEDPQKLAVLEMSAA